MGVDADVIEAPVICETCGLVPYAPPSIATMNSFVAIGEVAATLIPVVGAVTAI
jgi:hypothetical protein